MPVLCSALIQDEVMFIEACVLAWTAVCSSCQHSEMVLTPHGALVRVLQLGANIAEQLKLSCLRAWVRRHVAGHTCACMSGYIFH